MMLTRTPLLKLLTFVFLGAIVSACSVSFQSRQIEALTGLFGSVEDPLESAKWSASWNGFDFDLYAANGEGEVFFLNRDGAYLHFNGWNITETREILSNGQSVRIEAQAGDLLYFVDDRLLDRHPCAEWKSEQLGDGVTRYLQECIGRETYTNQIDVDPEGLIIRLHFILHPQYPAMTILPAIQVTR